MREYFDEVYREPFYNKDKGYWTAGPWQSHTKRMLRHKALIQGARIAFGFAGIYDEDEAHRIIEGEAIVEKPPIAQPRRLSEVTDEAPEENNRSTDVVVRLQAAAITPIELFTAFKCESIEELVEERYEEVLAWISDHSA